jgi:hypothetical protein
MKATEFTIGRQFYLGTAGPAQTPETISVSIGWSLEGETIEEAEAKAIPKLYEMADRERKRRYAHLKSWRDEKDLKKEKETGVTASAGA